MSVLIITALLAIAPISELRGAIPFALANSMPVVFCYFYCVILNFCVSPLVYFFLMTFHKLFYKISFYRNFFDKFIERARKKLAPSIEKYGIWGLTVFVAIPLPVTGAVTGTFGAWVLGMEKKKVFPAVLIGVAIAGVIVSVIAYFGIEAFSFFTKKM